MAKVKKKQPKTGNKTMIRPYNIVNSGENEAEIDMYGDVYMDTPRDWWTDEPIEGNFISAEAFLKDLDDLKDKDKITVHINSGGGDLYAGLAIYNRLKTLNAEITTINDGMAASAASLIFQAGDIRKMNAASNFMAHGVSGFLWGSYTVEDLEAMEDQFRAHNKAVVNVYAERMSISAEEAADFIDGETWLTGAEAVEKGLADEVIGDDLEDEDLKNCAKIQAAIKPFCSQILAGLKEAYPENIHSAKSDFAQGNADPEAVPKQFAPSPHTGKCTSGAVMPPKRINSNDKKKEDEPVIENVKELKEKYPDLVNEIEDAARQQERQRIQEIEDIESSVADKEMVRKAKFETPSSAKDLAFSVMQAQAAVGATTLENLKADAAASGAQAVAAEPIEAAMTDEEKKQAEIKAMLEQSDRMRGVK